jgi:hypothetical protein
MAQSLPNRPRVLACWNSNDADCPVQAARDRRPGLFGRVPGFVGTGLAFSPSCKACIIARAWSGTCSLVKMLEIWFRTVLGASMSRSAIAALFCPVATKARISRARSVRSGNGSDACRPPKCSMTLAITSLLYV